MNGMMPKANVYYLPAAEPIGAPTPLPRWARFRNRLLSGWWRARLSLADLHIGGRFREDDYSALLRSVVEESPAELIQRRPPKPSRPATVLDFEAGRLRLRAATS